MIDWSHFTPWSSLAGGLLIGVATAMFLGSKPLIFTIAMLADMVIFEIQDRYVRSPAKKAA